MDMSEFDQDTKIDPNQLDVEACLQAELFFKWAEKSIEVKYEVDRLKSKRDIMEKRLQLQVRSHPHKFDLDKVTEAAVMAAVILHVDFQEITEEWLQARRDYDLISHAVTAMEMRKRMIEVLITLHGQSYFAGPSVPRDLVSAYNEVNKERDQKTKVRQRNRARKRKGQDA